MPRDLDLLRLILLKMESDSEARKFFSSSFATEKYDEKTVSAHLKMLLDAGYIEASKVSRIGQPHDDYIVKSITMAGHDYLDTVRDDTVWDKTKKKVKETGLSVSLEMIKSVAVAMLKETLGV